MHRFAQSRLFVFLAYGILVLVFLYLLSLVRPMLVSVYSFLKAVLAPFLVAMIISYVLHPVVSLLHERKVPRTAAVLLIYAVFIFCCTVFLVNVVPVLIGQIRELNEHIPELSMKTQQMLNSFNNSDWLPPGIREGINRSIAALEREIEERIADAIRNIGSMVNAVFVVAIIPFLSFYMLKDMDVFERAALHYVPRSRRKAVVRLLKDIDQALGSYIRGQFIVSLCVGVLAYIGYALIGMPYPLLMASFVALFDIIPYLGPFLGALPALVMASTISWKMMLLVVLVNLICQNLESNVISPQVVGRTLHIHPLTIILVLLVGGELAGVAGLILAVPAYAALKVIFQHLFAYYIRRKTV